MGQKINPVGLRLGYIKDWKSRWFAKKNYTQLLHEDLYVRRYVKEKLYHGGIADVVIERTADQVRVKIHAAKPGIIIGKKGAEVDQLRTALQKMTKKQINVDVLEVKEPELCSQLIAENIASQLERRIAYRRAMKKSIQTAMQYGALGIKIKCGGRLAGAEIARHEWYLEGRLPLHTLRADIDFGTAEALTTYGLIGVKVWVFKGEILGPERQLSEETKARIERKAKGAQRRPRPVKPRTGGAGDFRGGRPGFRNYPSRPGFSSGFRPMGGSNQSNSVKSNAPSAPSQAPTEVKKEPNANS